MKDRYFPDNVITKLVNVLRSITDVHSVYLIGAQKESRSSLYVLGPNKEYPERDLYTITLLIISRENVAQPKEFMNAVFTKMDERVKIYPILYTLNDVKYRLDSGDNFLSRFLSPQNEIYCSQRLLPFGYCFHPKMYTIIKKEWGLHLNRAYYFEDKADILDTINDENARMFLLSQALQQASIALLYVFWEYKPSYYDLNHLLNLCNHFCNSPKLVFPKTSFRSYRVYHALCHAEYNAIFKSNDFVSLGDSDYAHNLSRRFLDKANREGTKKLEELEQLHHKPEAI